MNIVLFGDSHLGRFGKDPSAALERIVDNSVVYNCSAGGFTSADGALRAPLLGTLNPHVLDKAGEAASTANRAMEAAERAQ